MERLKTRLEKKKDAIGNMRLDFNEDGELQKHSLDAIFQEINHMTPIEMFFVMQDVQERHKEKRGMTTLWKLLTESKCRRLGYNVEHLEKILSYGNTTDIVATSVPCSVASGFFVNYFHMMLVDFIVETLFPKAYIVSERKNKTALITAKNHDKFDTLVNFNQMDIAFYLQPQSQYEVHFFLKGTRKK